MALVHVTSCFLRTAGEDRCLNEYRRLKTCLSSDRFGVHAAADDPDEADVIVFAELGNWAGNVQDHLLRDPIYRRFADKSVHFNPRLKAPPITPGIYGSAPRAWCAPGYASTSHYLETALERDFITAEPFKEASLLYSFRGSSNTWIGRREILSIQDERADLVDTAKAAKADGEEYRDHFVRSIANSKFVICPRGTGPASLRVFEVLRAGRVPVVVADDWLPPRGPDWESCALFVRESDVGELPDLLRRNEHRAEEMASEALRVHNDWFAADVSFHRVVEWSIDILSESGSSEAISHRKRMRRSYSYFKLKHASRKFARRFSP